MTAHALGIDVVERGVRAVLVNERGTVVRRGSSELADAATVTSRAGTVADVTHTAASSGVPS